MGYVAWEAVARQRLAYDPNTGSLVWKDGPCAGKEAGTPDGQGYKIVRINGRVVGTHRVAWVVAGNDLPKNMQIDHINGDRRDNRLENLRLATSKQNNWNRRRTGKYPKGVSICGSGRYRAAINIYRRKIHLGVFDTPSQAANAYKAAASAYVGEFARW